MCVAKYEVVKDFIFPYDSGAVLDIPFRIKRVFLVIIGKVFVIGWAVISYLSEKKAVSCAAVSFVEKPDARVAVTAQFTSVSQMHILKLHFLKKNTILLMASTT